MQKERRLYKELIVGQSYFYVGFHDFKFTAPAIDTYVYVGEEHAQEGESKEYLFESAASYFHKIERHLLPADIEEPEGHYISFDDAGLIQIADKQGLIVWLNESASSFPYPNE